MVTLENTKTVKDLVQNACTEYKSKVFMRYERNDAIYEKTYEELAVDSKAISCWIDKLSNDKGHRMHAAMIGRCSYKYLTALLGVVNAGGVAVPLDIQLSKEGFQENITRADVEVLFYDWEFQSQVEVIKKTCPAIKYYVCFQNLRLNEQSTDKYFNDIVNRYNGRELNYEVKADQLALIIYTSGTTGHAKGVMLSHGNLVDNTFCSDDLENAEDEVCMNVLPIHHVFCLSGDLFLVLRYGITLSPCPDVAKMLDYIKIFKPTSIRVVPMMAKMLYNKVAITSRQNPELSLIEVKNQVLGERLNRLISGGGYLAEDLASKLCEIGITVGQGYGMSECSPKISVPAYGRVEKMSSVGHVVRGCEVRIVEGEIQVKSPSVMMGYYKDPELTAEAITEDGFLRTGDLGYVDNEGFIYLTGRKKNLIILSNGENVSPEAIENKFDGDILVTDILVYGKGAVIAAEVYPNYEYAQVNGIDNIEEAVQNVVNLRNKDLPSYSRIAQVTIRKHPFEKTSSNKIIRDKFFEQQEQKEKKIETFQAPKNEAQEAIYAIVAEVIGHEEFGVSDNLYECGLDSMGSVLLIEELHNRLDKDVTLTELLEYNTIIALDELFQAKEGSEKLKFEKLEVYPLTGMMSYFAYVIAGNTTGNLPFTYKLDMGVDLDRLKSAITDVIDAHPGLKGIIRPDGGWLKLFRDDDRVIEIPIIKTTEAEIGETLQAQLVPFTYRGEDNLIHVSLYETEAAKYMFLDVAHLMGDGISMNILMEDINKRYAGEEIEKEGDYTFYEYILENQHNMKSGAFEKDVKRIGRQLRGAKLKRSILTKKELVSVKTGEYGSIRRRLDKIVKKELLYFCKQNGVSENVMFLTAFNYCMALFSGEDDIFSNSIHSGRTDSRWSRIAGCLFMTYFCRYEVTPHERVIELLKKTGDQIMNSMKSITPVSRQGDFFFQYQGDILEIPEIGGLPSERVRQQLDALPFHMQVMCDDKGYYTELRYWENRFDRSLLEIFIDCLEYVLVAMMSERSVRRLKKHIPDSYHPKHFEVEVSALEKEFGAKLLKEDLKDSKIKVYVMDEHYLKKPYGGWGDLYIMDHEPVNFVKTIENPYGEGTLYKTGVEARILPDGTVDFLENSGRIVLTDGSKGRRFFDLKAAEARVNTYDGVATAECYMSFDEKTREMTLRSELHLDDFAHQTFQITR